MKAKDLKKVTEMYQRIQQLDKDITRLEKSARDISERPVKGVINFEIPKEKKERVQFDEDGSIMGAHMQMRHMLFGGPVMFHPGNEPKKSNPNSFEVSESDMLSLYEVLLRRRLAERDMILTELNRMGIDI